MIYLKTEGSFKNIKKFINECKRKKYLEQMDFYGQRGVELLSAATPKDSGNTANSWTYTIEETANGFSISWHNNNIVDGWLNVALALQYGHGTGTGGYVEGIDYINPTLKPLFDEMIQKIWGKVADL